MSPHRAPIANMIAEELELPPCTGWTKVVIGLVILALVLPSNDSSDASAILALAFILVCVTSRAERQAVGWLTLAAMFIVEARRPDALMRCSWAVTSIDWIRVCASLHVWSRVTHFIA